MISPRLFPSSSGSHKGMFALVFLGILFGGPGCKPGEKTRHMDSQNAVIRIGIGSEPKDLDPHLVTGLPDFQVLMALFEGLVRAGPDDRTPVVPGVAREWSLSADGKTYRFQLRSEARWSNGDPVTAGDFVFSVKRVLDPKLGSPHAEWLYDLTGAENYHRGLDSDFSKVGVRAPSPTELVISLQYPVPYFLELIKHPAWYPVHPETIRKSGADRSVSTGWTRPPVFVGNGPFLLEGRKPGNMIRVKKNPHYAGVDPVRPDAIEFYPIDNKNTEALAFRTGQLDITDDVPFPMRSSYRERRDPAYREYPVLATTYLVFNTRKPPLDDPGVRKALSLAIDRLSITEDVARAGTPATGYVPSSLPGYPSRREHPHDPDQARNLLAASGYPGGAGFPRLEYSLSTSDTSRQIAEAIQNMWKEVLNIDVDLVNSEFRIFLDRLNQADFDLGYLAWYADFIDPYAFLNMMREDNPSNRSGWKNEQYESLLDQSQQILDPEQRLPLLRSAESVLIEQSPIAPIYWITKSRLVDPELKGWAPRLMDLHPYQYLYFSNPDSR